MKRRLCLFLIFALMFCFLVMATGCEELDDFASIFDDNAPAKTAESSPDNTENLSIPDFVGMTVAQAKAAANNAGISITKTTYKKSIIQYDQAWKYAIEDYGAKQQLWKVTAQQAVKANQVEFTIELNAISTNNNAEFRTIMNESNDGSADFVKNHTGELVEFTGVIRITAQNSTYRYTYTIYGYDDSRSHVAEMFCFNDIDYHAVSNCTDKYSKIDTSSYFHIVAEIKGFDNNKGILLKPVGIEYIGAIN